MPSVPLRELLPEEALAEIATLMREGRCDAENLKQVTHRYRSALLTKGIDSDYLAYAIALKVVQAQCCS